MSFSFRILGILMIAFVCSTAEASKVCNQIAKGETNEIIQLMKMGYEAEVATRMIENDEPVVAHILTKERSLPPLNDIVVDRARYHREFNLAKMRRPRGLKPITIFRGIALRDPKAKIQLSLQNHLASDYRTVGNVAWVTPEYTEAEYYATYGSHDPETRAGYVLKFQIPANLLFQKEEWGEGFLHPKQVRTLDSFLIGAYEIRQKPPQYKYSTQWDGRGYFEKVPSPVEKIWIPYAKLPKRIFKK